MKPKEPRKAKPEPWKTTTNSRLGDPFGLAGSNIHRTECREDEIPDWASAMRDELCERWEFVKKLLPIKKLAEKLSQELGRHMSEPETKLWFEDAKQDHEWRMRLLDKETEEGRLYHAYAGIMLVNEHYSPSPERTSQIREYVMYLLDLLDPPSPGVAPSLLPAHVVSLKGVMGKKNRGLLLHPLEGIVIPRRFSRERAIRFITEQLNNRPKFRDVMQRRLQAEIAESMEPYRRMKEAGQTEGFFGRHAMQLAAVLQDPMFQLPDTTARRNTSLTKRELKRARQLFADWYPLVKRLTKRGGQGSLPTRMPSDVLEYFKHASKATNGPKRITLLMVSDRLELGIGADALNRRLKSKS